MSQNPLLWGGQIEKQADSVCYVSYWHLPGGYDAVNAEARIAYFAEVENAKRFVLKSDREQMADLCLLDEIPSKHLPPVGV